MGLFSEGFLYYVKIDEQKIFNKDGTFEKKQKNILK